MVGVSVALLAIVPCRTHRVDPNTIECAHHIKRRVHVGVRCIVPSPMAQCLPLSEEFTVQKLSGTTATGPPRYDLREAVLRGAERA